MKYYVTNGIDYLLKTEDGQNRTTQNVAEATRFKETSAINYIRSSLKSPNWGYRRVEKIAPKNKTFVITTGCKYLSNTGDVVLNINQAKTFNSIADAEAFVQKHNQFHETYIIDENFKFVAKVNIKSFTEEQLQTLGLNSERKHKRTRTSQTTRDLVYEQGNGICALCGRPISKERFTIDHILPLNRGGSNDLSNLQISCEFCNKLKGDSKNEEYLKGATTILAHKVEEKYDKEIAYPLIRSFVRGMILEMYGQKVSDVIIGGMT